MSRHIETVDLKRNAIHQNQCFHLNAPGPPRISKNQITILLPICTIAVEHIYYSITKHSIIFSLNRPNPLTSSLFVLHLSRRTVNPSAEIFFPVTLLHSIIWLYTVHANSQWSQVLHIYLVLCDRWNYVIFGCTFFLLRFFETFYLMILV